MPRYFFPIHVDEEVARDPTGIELRYFRYLSHAIAEANKARLEIVDEEALDQLWLEIMDERTRRREGRLGKRVLSRAR